jgi:hypothetical protein
MRAAVAAVLLLGAASPAFAEQVQVLVEGGGVVRSFDNPVTQSPEPDLGLMLAWRVGVTYRQVYLAVEGEVGGVVRTDGIAARDLGTEVLGQSPHHGHLEVVQGVFIAGARATHGRSVFGVELAAGGRRVDYSFATREQHRDDRVWVTGDSKVVEARARAGYWLTPWISAGVSLGTSLHDQSWMGGFHIAVQTDRR